MIEFQYRLLLETVNEVIHSGREAIQSKDTKSLLEVIKLDKQVKVEELITLRYPLQLSHSLVMQGVWTEYSKQMRTKK